MEWLVPVAVLVLLGIAFLCERTLRGQARALEAFIRGVTLPLTDAALAAVPRRLFRASVGAVLGMIPALLAFTWAWDWAPELLGSFTVPTLILLTLSGTAIGIAIACTTNIGPARPDSPRIARATRPRMTDYLSPTWTVTSIATCTTAVIVAVLVLPNTTAHSTLTTIAIVLVVASVLTLALCTLLARRLLASPQPANDRLELAWDDALRARALRSVWVASLAMSASATLFVVNLGTPRAAVLFAFEYALSLTAMLAFNRMSRPGRRFQRRLWPRTPQPARC